MRKTQQKLLHVMRDVPTESNNKPVPISRCIKPRYNHRNKILPLPIHSSNETLLQLHLFWRLWRMLRRLVILTSLTPQFFPRSSCSCSPLRLAMPSKAVRCTRARRCNLWHRCIVPSRLSKEFNLFLAVSYEIPPSRTLNSRNSRRMPR